MSMLYARRKLVAFLTAAFLLGVVPALAAARSSRITAPAIDAPGAALLPSPPRAPARAGSAADNQE
jgi:hypothetical protein